MQQISLSKWYNSPNFLTISRRRHALSQSDERADRCCRNLSSETRLCALPIMQNHNNNGAASSTRESRAGSSRRAPKRSRLGRVSHQLRLEINRRQMERSPAGLDGWPISHPSLNPPRTIRLFSANTKRYTSRSVIVILEDYANFRFAFTDPPFTVTIFE